MADILERIRKGPEPGESIAKVVFEAGDEIQRLRRERVEMLEDLKTAQRTFGLYVFRLPPEATDFLEHLNAAIAKADGPSRREQTPDPLAEWGYDWSVSEGRVI